MDMDHRQLYKFEDHGLLKNLLGIDATFINFSE